MALCLAYSFFLPFEIIVIQCSGCECITMVRCVAYIHELCMNLTFGLNIQIIFSHGFESGKMSFLFDIGIRNFCIWVYHHETHVVYILDLCMTFTFDLYGGILSEFYLCFIYLQCIFHYQMIA